TVLEIHRALDAAGALTCGATPKPPGIEHVYESMWGHRQDDSEDSVGGASIYHSKYLFWGMSWPKGVHRPCGAGRAECLEVDARTSYHCDIERPRRTTHGLDSLHDARNPCRICFEWEDSVVSCGSLYRAARSALGTEPQRNPWLLDRPGADLHVFCHQEPTVGDGLAGPQCGQNFGAFIERSATLTRIGDVTEGRVLSPGIAACAQPHDQSATTQVVEGHRLACQFDHPPSWQWCHHRPQLDPAGDCCRSGQYHPGIRDRPLARYGTQDVIPNEKPIPARILSGLCNVGDRVRVSQCAEERHVDCMTHRRTIAPLCPQSDGSAQL
ncbi:hypothetical protein C8K38_119150, partial [Rhodococcus sp. OK611]